MNRQSLHYYEFGPFRLNVTERLLQKRDEVVPLTPKLIDTLVVLVQNTGHVMTKEGLMQSLWPDSFVEESSLTQNISLLRKALAENGSGQQYIETIPKRGYRFVAEVRDVNGAETELVLQERLSTEILIEEEQFIEAESSSASQTRGALLTPLKGYSKARVAIVLGVVLTLAAAGFAFFRNRLMSNDQPSARNIAVLPFRTIGSQSDNDLLGLGMADALILKLSALDSPVVLPTSTVWKYTTREKDALLIGRDLGVDAVLDGTVQRDGDRVRVTVQMIRLSDGKVTWSDKFDEPYRDIFTLQDSISQRLATAMASNVPEARKGRMTRHSTDNTEAYNAYLTGLFLWNKRGKENLTRAIGYLEQAIEKDPNFARAHALLADCYFLSADGGLRIVPSDKALMLGNQEAARALELDNEIAEAHTVKAGLLLFDRDTAGARREFSRALELNPRDPIAHVRYGYFLFADADMKGALSHMDQAVALDPVSPTAHVSRGYVLIMSRDYDGAITAFERARDLQPELVLIRFNLIEAYLHKQMFSQALAELEQLKEADPRQVAMAKLQTHAAMGRRREAQRILLDLRRSENQDVVSPYSYAIMYGAVGEKDEAFTWLEKISDTRFNRARLRFDPALDPLRDDPRFAECLRRLPVEPEIMKPF